MEQSFFQGNRQRLARQLKGAVIVLTAHASQQRSNDAAFAFEQEANFWYLTGIEQPDWRVIICSDRSWLVAPETSVVHDIFDGSLSWDEAKKQSGVDAVISKKDAAELLEKLAQGQSDVFTLGKDPHQKYYDFAVNPAPAALRRELRRTFGAMKDCRLDLARLRAIKQPAEIEAMRGAIDLTIEAFVDVKRRLATFNHEYHVEAAFSYHFRSNGAEGHAYEPIVAYGKSACTLHYTDNSAPLSKNGLLLLDIGARVGGYAADITRTYQLGSPTDRQKQVHATVRAAHEEIIALLRPGLLVKTYQETVDEIMKRALESLGLLKKPDDYRKYFPHAISHGLGIDVHDALGRPDEFKEGMVLTVEPGIYIPEEEIGVRIEDDILITKTGHENLSAALPTSL